MLINFDTLYKLKIFVWILAISVVIVEILMIRRFFSNLNENNLINIAGSILSLFYHFICAIIIGNIAIRRRPSMNYAISFLNYGKMLRILNLKQMINNFWKKKKYSTGI